MMKRLFAAGAVLLSVASLPHPEKYLDLSYYRKAMAGF